MNENLNTTPKKRGRPKKYQSSFAAEAVDNVPQNAPENQENNQMNAILTSIHQSLISLHERIEKLESARSPQATERKIEFTDGIQSEEIKEQEKMAMPTGAPVPREYREIVNTILNKSFSIAIEYRPDAFDFTVIVPEQYSNIPEKDKRLTENFKDWRSKVIPYHLGVQGVTDWVNLIYKNFNSETRAKIMADRT